MCGNQIFLIFGNILRSKQNKKTPAQLFVVIDKQEACAKFQQKLLNSRVFGARQSFQILKQNFWFLEKNIALSKFLYEILYYLTSIIKL